MKGHSLRIGDTVKEIQGTIDPQEERGTLRIDGASLEVSFKPLYPGCHRIVLEGRPYTVWVERQGKAKHICVRGSAFIVEDAARSKATFARRRSIEEGPGEVTPPMPSVVVRVLVNEGDRVEKGQGLLVVTAVKEAGVKPEMECFDTGHVGNCYPLIDMGLLEPPHQVSLIMGVLGGIPPTVENLAHQVRMLPPQSEWEVIGISHDQWRMVAAAIALGGNVRVGLEDNFYVAPGVMAKSNGELVEKAARMIRDQGREVAMVEECREKLGLKHR